MAFLTPPVPGTTDNVPHFRPVYRVLLRPMTILGVERRLFFLCLIGGACTFRLFETFVGGLLVSGSLFAIAARITSRDPQMLAILMRTTRHRARYDSAKPSCHSMELR